MRAWVEVPAKAGETWATVLIDVDDFERLAGRSLSIGSHGYAQMFDGIVQTLHGWLMGTTGSGRRVLVDHDNRNKLDCRRSNLRLVDPSTSNLNRPQMDGEYVGTYQIRSGRWQAKLRWRRERHHVGTFDTRDEARNAIQAYRKQIGALA